MLRKMRAMISPVPVLVVLTVIAVSFGISSCNSDKMYRDYKNYGKGYEAARKGGSKPFLWSSKAEKEGYQAGLDDLSSGAKIPLVEFQYTEEEIKSLEDSWPTFEKMLDEALKGNCNAMFAIGLCYLYGGKGLPIDVAKANMCFGKAASIGHAPSLDKIRAMYLEDVPNPFLHQVYVNLVIALGHTEYTLQYHRSRADIVEKFGKHGKQIVEEIERIAEEKLKQIYENIDDLELSKKSKNNDAFFLALLSITLTDFLYDLSYWSSIAGVSDK